MAIKPLVFGIQGDNRAAQAAIQETLNAVKGMARAIDANSRTAVNAFRAEAQEAQRLLGTLKATQAQHAALARSVASVDTQVAGLSRQYALSTKQMVAGAAQVVASQDLMGGGMRGLINQASNLAFSFGATGPIVAAAGIAAIAILDIFERTREEMRETQDDAIRMMRELAKAGPEAVRHFNEGTLEREITKARAEVASIQGKFAATPGMMKGGIENRADFQKASARLKDLENQRQALLAANQQRQAQEAAGAANAEKTRFDRDVAAIGAENERRNIMGMGQSVTGRFDMSRIIGQAPGVGPSQPFVVPPMQTEGVLMGPAAEGGGAGIGFADAMVAGFEKVRDGALQTETSLLALGDAAGSGLANAADQGLDALISGHGNAIKILKKAAAEPIVAHLHMTAKKEAVLAVASWPNAVAMAKHAAGAAAAVAGARFVARLGGIGGGEGGGGGGGGGGAAASGAAASRDRNELLGNFERKSVLTVRGSGLFNMSDPVQRDALARGVEDLLDDLREVSVEVS